MIRQPTYFADRIEEKARNAVGVYRYARPKGVRWASSVKRSGEEAAREYGDRFLVELIQNAYDANPRGATDGKVSVALDLGEGEHGVLYVANTGRAFSDENFDAITDLAQSDKPPGEGIGNKGVGFKSVLQVCQWPEVYSARPNSADDRTFDGYCFRFPTPSDLAEFVDEEDLDDVLRDVPPYSLPIPIDRIADRVLQFRRAGYCTVIRLPLDSDQAAERVKAEIGRLVAATTPLLLFLDRIALLQLHIDSADGSVSRDDQLLRRTKSIGAHESLEVTEVDLGEQGTFVVASRPVAGAALNAAVLESAPEIDERWASWTQASSVSVAAQLDHAAGEWHFYTFLPMDDSPAPFSAHANAPFFTKLDRNSVRFSVRFNALLLDEIAALCVDAALWIRDNTAGYAPLCLDLICWHNEHLPRLKKAFDLHGIAIDQAELVPIVSRDGSASFGAVGVARRWGPFDPPMTTVTAERLCADNGAAIVDPQLGDRIDNFSQLRLQLPPEFDDGEPTDDELAQWLERIAKNLRRSDPAPSGQEWMDFYDDIATAFANRDARALQGRRLIIDDNNRLQRCGTSDDGSKARTVFFAPVRDQTEGEEDVDSAFDVTRPPELSKVISFTREDLDWYVRADGSQRAARRSRQFLEDKHLVRRYRTQDVLAAVGRFVRSRRKEVDNEAAMHAALNFVYEFKDRAPDAALAAVGLHVPTQIGWRPATEAWFSAPWPQTQGTHLSRLIQLTGSTSPALAAVGEHLLQAPEQWLSGAASLQEWTSYLRRLGVRDGLQPTALTKDPFRTYGSGFTPGAWARFADLGEDFARAWTARVEDPGECSSFRMTLYTSVTELWGLPGQFEFEQFSTDAQDCYAALVVKSLEVWPHDCLTVGARRANHHQDPLVRWPSPVQVFLRGAAWVPVMSGDDSQRCTPAEAWFFDDDNPDSAPKFAPLMLWQLRRTARGNDVAQERLRSWCGIRCWNDVRDAPDLLQMLFAMLHEGRVNLSEMASLAKEYERALHNSLEQGSSLWSAGPAPGVVIRRGDQVETLELELDCGPVYVDTGADPGTAKLLRELGVPILCARPVDGAKAAASLREIVADEGVQLLSDVQVSVEVDGAPFTDDTPGIALIASGREWLIDLIVAALEFRSGQFRRYSDRALRDAATLLRAVRLVPARELLLSIDGHKSSEGAQRREVFPVLDPSRPAIVVTGFDGDIGWDTLEEVAHPIAAVAGLSEIGSVIFEAIVRLKRTRPASGDQQPPTPNQCAEALGITRRQMDYVTALLQSALDILRDRIPVAVACLVSTAASEELIAL